VTVPWEYTPEYRVRWLPEAEQLWKKIRADEPLTSRLSEGAVKADAAPGPEPSGSPSASPSQSPYETPSETTESPSETPSETQSPTPEESEQAQEEAAANGLCA
jgi:hypothetical protein